MTRQNRVLPTGEIVAVPARGDMMGNRGILHRDDGTLGTARWRHRAWVACRLAFRGRRREVMAPNRYTELFFLDEAVALAAGHRPCGECRREEHRAFLDAARAGWGPLADAAALDAALHPARVRRDRSQVTLRAAIGTLPAGAFVHDAPGCWLVLDDALLEFAPEGYRRRRPRPSSGEVEVLTPAPTLAALRAGYRPRLHATATADA